MKMKKLWAFVDERKNIADEWYYFLVLLIPDEQATLVKSWLHSAREDFHSPIKFAKLNSNGRGRKVEIAKTWMQEVLRSARDDRNDLYFSLTGLNLNRLDPKAFGGANCAHGQTLANIHNRFFRKSLSNAITDFWGGAPILIRKVFHDSEGNLQNHQYFDWHAISKTMSDHSHITFESDNITFVLSDHRKEKHHENASHIIQLVDVLLGAITYCFHPSHSRNKGQEEVAMETVELVKRLSHAPRNPNSAYNYYKKFKVGFFPKKNSYAGEDDLFYHRREIELLNMKSGQQIFELC